MSADWSSDGTRLAFIEHRRGQPSLLNVLDATTGELHRSDVQAAALLWRPQARQILLLTEAGPWAWELYDLAEGRPIGKRVGNYPLAWSPDGRYLVWRGSEGAGVRHVATGADEAVPKVLPLGWGPESGVLYWITPP